MLDASDRDRLSRAKHEFLKVVSDEQLSEASILVIANKQDLPNAASKEEIAQILNINEVAGSRKWFVQNAVATKGVGIREGFQWLAANMHRL